MSVETPNGASSAGGSPFTEEFNEQVDAFMQDWKMPGLGMVVVDGEETHAKGFGYASLPDKPFTPDTIAWIGSTTKAMVSTVIAHMIDSKQYLQLANGWKTTLKSLIPEDFALMDAWATENLTLEDAASHRTGLGDHESAVFPLTIDGRPATIREAVRRMRHLPMTNLAPRTGWHYSNVMYITLGYIAEIVAGKPLADLIKETVWAPLGMDSTYFTEEEVLSSGKPLSKSYQWVDEKNEFVKRENFKATLGAGAGSVGSTLLDFAKWLRCMANETAPFSEAVHKEMKTSRSIVDSSRTEENGAVLYGLGWRQTEINGVTMYWHTGGTMTHRTYACFVPSLKYGIATFCNKFGWYQRAEKIAIRRLLEDKLGIPTEKRVDIDTMLKKRRKLAEDKAASVVTRLFADKPETAIASRQPAEKLAGSYTHPGYGTLKFEARPDIYGGDGDKTNTILWADGTNSIFPSEYFLRHVSADYWIFFDKATDYSDTAGWTPSRSWFEFGLDGEATAFYLKIMVDTISEGIIQYTRES